MFNALHGILPFDVVTMARRYVLRPGIVIGPGKLWQTAPDELEPPALPPQQLGHPCGTVPAESALLQGQMDFSYLLSIGLDVVRVRWGTGWGGRQQIDAEGVRCEARDCGDEVIIIKRLHVSDRGVRWREAWIAHCRTCMLQYYTIFKLIFLDKAAFDWNIPKRCSKIKSRGLSPKYF